MNYSRETDRDAAARVWGGKGGVPRYLMEKISASSYSQAGFGVVELDTWRWWQKLEQPRVYMM